MKGREGEGPEREGRAGHNEGGEGREGAVPKSKLTSLPLIKLTQLSVPSGGGRKEGKG